MLAVFICMSLQSDFGDDSGCVFISLIASFHNICHPRLTGWQEKFVRMSRYPCQPLAVILTQGMCYLINENTNYLVLLAASTSPFYQPLPTKLFIHLNTIVFVEIKFYHFNLHCVFGRILVQYLWFFWGIIFEKLTKAWLSFFQNAH